MLDSRAIRWITGAKPEEFRRVVLSFLALLFLLISYYLIKPLRNSQFLKEFDSAYLPLVYFGVSILSLTVTKIFNQLANKVEKYRLIGMAFVAIILIKLAFYWLLLYGGKPAVVAFFFFASVYFLLAISTLWACINDIFTSEQSRRCFGFIAVGSTVGNIAGARLSKQLANSAFRDYATLFSSVSMALALVLIYFASTQRRVERAKEQEERSEPADAPKSPFWEDVRGLVGRPYVRRIGIMVMILAIFTTSLEFVSQGAIDRGLSQEQYGKSFKDLPAEEFKTIFTLRNLDDQERESQFQRLGQFTGVSGGDFQKRYEQYKDDLEVSTRILFSDIYLYQGLLSVFLLVVVAPVIFRKVGLRVAVLVLPCLAVITLVTFLMPIELLLVEILVVVTGSANYSLNNAAKEVLYAATDEETKFRHKPLIEGPGMRTGDAIASTLKFGLGLLVTFLGYEAGLGNQIFVFITIGLVFVWGRSIYLAGKEYDEERSR